MCVVLIERGFQKWIMRTLINVVVNTLVKLDQSCHIRIPLDGINFGDQCDCDFLV